MACYNILRSRFFLLYLYSHFALLLITTFETVIWPQLFNNWLLHLSHVYIFYVNPDKISCVIP